MEETFAAILEEVSKTFKVLNRIEWKTETDLHLGCVSVSKRSRHLADMLKKVSKTQGSLIVQYLWPKFPDVKSSCSSDGRCLLLAVFWRLH